MGAALFLLEGARGFCIKKYSYIFYCVLLYVKHFKLFCYIFSPIRFGSTCDTAECNCRCR
jgi:hypothetical protein